MNIGDIYFALRGDAAGLQVDAKKAGEAAGAAAGLAATKTLGSEFKRGLPGALSSFGTGILQGMGQQAWRGIDSAISTAVSAIPDLIERGKQYGLLIDEISDKTGASAEKSSLLVGTLRSLGVSTDGLGTNLRVLSKEITTNEAEFRRLGIATRDANGIQLDTVTVLDNVRRYLAGTADGADKLALASKLLGKSAGELIDYLNLTDAQAGLLETRLRSLGLVVGEGFRTESEKALRASQQLDLAWLGLGVTLQAELGPTIRSVLEAVTRFVIERMADIKTAISTVAAALAGLVSGLLGVDATSFVDQLSALGGEPVSATSRLGSRLADLNVQRAELVKNGPKVTSALGSNTAAIDRQSAAIDRQISALDRQDKAAEKVFARQMAGLAAVYQRQLDAMDAADRLAEVERRERDTAAEVAAARDALLRAQQQAAAGTGDTEAVAAAQSRFNDALRRQADERTQRERDEKRRRLEETKTYIESVAALEANAENRKALANTLANREKALRDKLAVATAAGDTEEVARLTSKIEAVQTAETRNNAALRTETRKTELQRAKDELATLRASITSSIGGGSTEAQKTFKANLAEIDAEIGRTRAALGSLYTGTSTLFPGAGLAGGGSPPLGTNGGLAKALAEVTKEWKQRAEEWRTAIIGDGTEGSGLVGAFQSLYQVIYDLTHLTLPDWLDKLLNPTPELKNLRNTQIVPKPGGGWQIIVPGGGGAGSTGGGYASGGVIPSGGWGWVGEAGLERAYSLPGGGTVIEPVAAAASGAGFGGQPAVIRLEIGGHALLDYVDERLTYRPR